MAELICLFVALGEAGVGVRGGWGEGVSCCL